VYFECQTQFGDVPWPGEGSAGTFLDPTQPVADRVGVANKYFSRTAHGRIVVLPDPKRFEKHLPIPIGKIAKTVQHCGDRLDHHLRRAHAATKALAKLDYGLPGLSAAKARKLVEFIAPLRRDAGDQDRVHGRASDGVA
jgi:hypothetical protein